MSKVKIRKKHIILMLCGLLAVVCILFCTHGILIRNAEYGFARSVSAREKELRLDVVRTAQGWLGSCEKDGSHQNIIDRYNGHSPLAQGYVVQYSDNWCATFVSCVAIECGLTDIIPTECSCERQINLFDGLGCWQESDGYVPLPGDLIFYCMTNKRSGDCVAWSDHVGIVVGTWNNRIKVIEGNNGDCVSYRYIPVNDKTIRGFGIPDYASKCIE